MMSLRAAAPVLRRRSNLCLVVGIASGEKQGRPRNDIVNKFTILLHPCHTRVTSAA